ncbi:hypothetical protein [Nonomuraea typhae]|uniref:XRE family transcriptional regulator n=1 Tax=Nonomuraea typhae TaxID=2603600 RepID=A0ABW7YNE1_9ACTN
MLSDKETDPAARAHLAETMDDRRVQLGLTWNQVAEKAGLTKEGLRSVRQETRKMMPLTKRGIEDALRWAAGSIDLVLAGNVPQVAVRARTSLLLSSSAVATAEHHDSRPTLERSTEESVQRWFTAELERRGLTAVDIIGPLDTLRAIADHNGQTLAEVLLESGLTAPGELIIRRPESEAVKNFRAEYERLAASPHLSKTDRKALQKLYEEALENLGKSGGDA